MNPRPGYIDGSMLLGNVHNPADATMIRFSHPSGEAVPVAVELRIDFTYEEPSELGKVDLSWHTDLAFREAELDAMFADARERGALLITKRWADAKDPRLIINPLGGYELGVRIYHLGRWTVSFGAHADPRCCLTFHRRIA